RVDLSRTVAATIDVIRGRLPPNVELQLSLSPDLPEVLASRPQIRQVLSSLVINAAESLGRGGGLVTVVTEHPARRRDVDYCRLAVSDTGCGIEPEVCGRIFDPFFSTKFIGRGLGLAAVQGIVRSLGGSVDVVSTPGVGSTFEVLLPCGTTQTEEF